MVVQQQKRSFDKMRVHALNELVVVVVLEASTINVDPEKTITKCERWHSWCWQSWWWFVVVLVIVKVSWISRRWVAVAVGK